jgi:hypothetical protein
MAFNQARAYETGGDALRTIADIDQGIRSQQTNRLGDLEYQLAVTKADRANTAYNRQQALFDQIKDPNKRLAAYLHPESYAKSQFPDPKDRFIKGDRNNLWDTGRIGADGNPTFIPGPDEGAGPTLWNGQPAGGARAPGGAPGGPGGPLSSLGSGFQRQQGGQMPNRPAPAVFQDQINQHAQRNGFDPRILSNLVTQESGGDHSAVSDAGAKGITQIMPRTAVDPGFGVKPLQNNTWEEAVRFGADYLGALNKYYMKKGKSPEEAMNLALGAYNWGPKNVDDWLAHGADLSKVPPETMGYIQNIIGPLVQQQPGQQAGQQAGSPQASPQASGGQNPVVPGSNLQVMRDPDNPRKYSTEFGWNPKGFNPETGQYTGAPERYPTRATTEVNIGDKTADQVGVKQRYDQLDQYRQKANTAQILQPKLMMLREQLQQLSTQGPGATSIINLLGTAQTIAKAAGLDEGTIKHYTAQLTGMNPNDPETLAKATKTVNDLVNISLRSAFVGLGSASDRDSQGVMAAAPNPNNPLEANMYLIDKVLLPGVQRDMEIWKRVNPLQRTDNQLLSLDDTVMQFNEEWNRTHYQKAPQADPNTPDPNKPPADPNARKTRGKDATTGHDLYIYTPELEQEIQRDTQKYPGAKKAPNGNWYMPNPDNPPGGPAPYKIIMP